MGDQHDDSQPAARCIGAGDATCPPQQATAPPTADAPLPLGERAALRIRLAELSAVVDTIETALRDARDAGLKVTPRHERVTAMANAAARLLRALNRQLD